MSSLHIPKNQEEEGVNPGQPHNKSKFFSPLTFFELLPYLNENQLKKKIINSKYYLSLKLTFLGNVQSNYNSSAIIPHNGSPAGRIALAPLRLYFSK